MDRTSQDQDWTIEEGTEIVGSDGDKVGKVVAVENDQLVVEKGFLFPSDYYIPTSAISNFDGDKVYLNVTKDQALDQDWGTQPEATAASTTDTVDRSADYDTQTATEGDTLNVPVMEEELTATRREVDRGAVHVQKDVVEEERTLDVPVTEERVTVQRRAVDRDATADDASFQGGTIEVQVMGQEVDVSKRARVTEEIEIGKEAVERTERVTDTVRREEVRVDDQSAGVVDADRSDRTDHDWGR